MNFGSEEQIENNLIKQLTEGESQWTYRKDLKTEDDLWNNFREKLTHNNLKVLDGHPLTDQEFEQIKTQLNFVSFYDAGEWLAGENGIAKVQVQREDASLGIIRLEVLRREDVAGGTSSYEVINQFKSEGIGTESNRRFDVSLLINGIPMIHIELKNHSTGYMDGFRQIKKYLDQGHFTGIFSMIQMFVVSNGMHTRYIAASKANTLNDKFLTNWVDPENTPVEDYLDFTKAVLSIPMAHKMVTQYTVLDSKRKALIMLRPYQVHAIEAIREASKRREGGYVWHTTGSGKTLTSYKVARNLLSIPSIDKTVFVIDRVDLDQQTTASFTSYSENDVIDVNETENVNELINKLLSNDRNSVIVTTIQKFNIVMKRMAGKEETSRYKKLAGLRIAFVVDECHRAVSPQKQEEIKSFFNQSLWYGFTGTPIFAENAKAEFGDLARTTEEQYGKRLHQYTVKEAIHDKAVLGFQVEYKSTIDSQMLDDIVEAKEPNLKVPIDQMEPEKKESYLDKETFEDEEHMLEVINSIVNKSKRKLGINRGSGRSYVAILTTSSIPNAQKYYDLFQKVIRGESSVKVSDSIKKLIPDFPKVAITYSVGENNETGGAYQTKIQESIDDYNEMFGTNFRFDNLRAYNTDLNNRLARKQPRFNRREEQLDLVIVVDRLLTGFDAPCLSTVFIDRAPQPPHQIIQTFSRTNRLFDGDKHYGQIVTFQTPNIFKNAVDNALKLYSDGGENYILAPEYDEIKDQLVKGLSALKEVAESPEEFDIESELPKLQQFAKAFQQVDSNYDQIQVYSEYDHGLLEQEIGLDKNEIERYAGVYNNVIEKIKQLKSGGDDPEPIEINIDYQLQTIKEDEINYEYIVSLIQSVISTDSNQTRLFIGDKEAVDIENNIDEIKKRNPKLGGMINDLWNQIKENPEEYRDADISMLLEEMRDHAKKKVIYQLSQDWALDIDPLTYYVDNFKPGKDLKQAGEADLSKSSDYKKYKETHEDAVIKLRYWPLAKKEIATAIEKEIIPLEPRR